MASHVPFAVIRTSDNDNLKSSAQGTYLNYRSNDDDDDAMASYAAPPGYRPAPTQPSAASRLPWFAKLPLAIVMSLTLNTVLYTALADFAGYELAAVSRTYTENWQVAGLLGWKVTEVTLGWWAGYDCMDIAALFALTNAPYYYLLYTFYSIDAMPCLIALSIDVISAALPFFFLRSLAHFHIPTKSTDTRAPNRAITHDSSIRFFVVCFAASIYGIFLYGCFCTWLPSYMIVHFDGLRSLDRAHDAIVPVMLATFIPLGYATMEFLFTAATGSFLNPGPDDAPAPSAAETNYPVAFDPETATLAETLAHNTGLGELSHRAKILASRTVVLALLSAANTFIRVYGTVDGTEMNGALGYAAVWGAAQLMTGFAYGYVVNE